MEDSKKANLGQELEDDQLDDTAGGIYADTFPKAPCECCGNCKCCGGTKLMAMAALAVLATSVFAEEPPLSPLYLRMNLIPGSGRNIWM